MKQEYAIELLKLSESLAGNGTRTNLRTAVNRAYYSAFHYIWDFLNKLGVRTPENTIAYSLPKNILSAVPEEELNKCSRKLNDLYSARLTADYRLDKPIYEKKSNVLLQIEAARGIITAISQLNRDENKVSELKNQAADYLRKNNLEIFIIRNS